MVLLQRISVRLDEIVYISDKYKMTADDELRGKRTSP